MSEDSKGEPGPRGKRGFRGLRGNTGPKGEDSVTPEQLMKAIRWAAGFGVAGLFAVGIALAIFVVTAANERAEICEVVEKGLLGQAQVLVRATEPDEPLTPERQKQRDTVVMEYLEGVHENLEDC